MDVLVDGVLFERFPVAREGFVITELDDPVGTKGEIVSRPSAHGDFDLPVFRQPRMITIKGAAYASSRWSIEQLQDMFYGILADGGHGDLTFMTVDGSRRCSVRLSGEPKFTVVGDEDADFQIGFRAADPRKYGEPREFSGSSVDVFHYGNFPASPVVEVVGPRTAPYTITGPGGRTVVVAQSLSAGQTHRIDFSDGGLYRNGVRQLGHVTTYRPWVIPPKQQTAMSISAGSMIVRVTDTYM